MKNAYYLVTIALTLTVLFGGCSDDDYVASAVDPKPMGTEAYMDSSYAPGDNFFMYAVGKWYNSTDLGSDTNAQAGLWADLGNKISERIKTMDNATIKKFWADTTTFYTPQESILDTLKTRVHLFDYITTKEEAWTAIAQTMKMGYFPLTNLFAVFGHKGRIYATFDLGRLSSYNSTAWISYCMQRLSYGSTASMSLMAKERTSLLSKVLTAQPDLNIENMEKHPEMMDNFAALSDVQTQSTGSELLDYLAKALDIDMENVYVYKPIASYFEWLAALSPEDVKLCIQTCIATDLQYYSQADLDEYNKDLSTNYTLSNQTQDVKDNYMNYIYSYAYAPKYVSDERKAEATQTCEEMRAAFHKRIESLDWMSETTKAYAHEKLDSMVFFVGRPDKWNEKGLPTLTGTSLVEDAIQLRKADYALKRDIVGKDRHEVGWEYMMCLKKELTQINASYFPYVNSMYIFPAFITEPFYDASKSDASNYAVFMAIGHEMTHGFDNNGCLRDKWGDTGNWWTVADQMEFEERQKLLVDCYNHLEITFGNDGLEGYYNDGTQTLPENIADLGGVNIIYDAYKAKLLKDGYNGEELLKQKRKFFLGIADLWRIKRSPASMFQWYNDWKNKTERHSMDKERVNGVCMNMDEWYDLFGVKWGDKNYLKPEKRTKIW